MIARHNHRRSNGGDASASSPMSPRNNIKSRRTPSSHSTIVLLLACFLSSVISFYAGIFVGMHMEPPEEEMAEPLVGATNRRTSSTVEWEINHKTPKEKIKQPEKMPQNQGDNKREERQQPTEAPSLRSREALIRERKLDYLKNHRRDTGIFLSALEYVDRDDFIQTFESLGVPFDPTEARDNDRVMILYGDPSAYPDRESILKSNSSYFESDSGISDPVHPHRSVDVILSVEDATKNCNNLHVVLTDHDRPNQCVALLGQYESFHVHKFMRASPNPDPNQKSRFEMDSSYPLRPVNRGMKTDGGRSMQIPTDENFRTNWRSLSGYLQNVEDVLIQLKPVASAVAGHNDRNTVVIMVCNFGQSELLMNFVCNVRARGLGAELSNVLLFSTDKETHELATTVLGLNSFYNEKIFGAMPKNAAGEYGDNVFRKMMFAKVYCVHLISMLGHDLLFQDVDVIWYKNPLQFFHNENDNDNTENNNHHHPENYDMIFQDDGNRGPYYAPYAANTGFYYVKNNPQTKAFFNSLLMSGDMILSSYSHQIALVQLLSEHASLYGLKVKIWNRNTHELPGGHYFHNKFDSMKKIVAGDIAPYIFHMSWTENKSNKVKFMQQMGMWYLQDTCRNKPVAELEKSDNNGGPECCSAEPLIQCHYKDKPSIIPCPDAPLIDPEGKSFW